LQDKSLKVPSYLITLFNNMVQDSLLDTEEQDLCILTLYLLNDKLSEGPSAYVQCLPTTPTLLADFTLGEAAFLKGIVNAHNLISHCQEPLLLMKSTI
jgi:hypothetical protein